ncbi:MAG: S41 family peptidase [Planctomycetota bacterium]|nr:MAG: S41 family peptidase [Planctomycetota bacterium]
MIVDLKKPAMVVGIYAIVLMFAWPVFAQQSSPPQGDSAQAQKWAILELDTQPAKVQVYYQNKLQGLTPLRLKVRAGQFHLNLYKPKYIIKVLRGRVQAGERKRISIKMVKDIEIPRQFFFKYAPKFVSSRKKAFQLFQKVLVYISYFHVSKPKETQLILGAVRTMCDILNKVKQRQALLKRELSEQDRKTFYFEDISLADYPLLQWKEKVVGPKHIFTLTLPQKTLKVRLDTSSLSSCLLGFYRIYEFIQDHYDTKDKITENSLMYAAFVGMLEVLGEPHTRLIPPKALKEMDVEVEGQFGGLGIVISQQNGILTVITPIDGTPAMRKGILEGDRIIEIEGKSTKNMTLLQAVSRLRGKPGTKVTITIQRGLAKKRITLTRALIKIKYIKTTILPGKIGLIRISSFMGKTLLAQLKEALIRLKKQGIRGLILDLRNNPGGLLDNAYKVCNLFLSSGLVVYTKGRISLYNEEFKADPKSVPKFLKIPLVVLINQGSASASEIVAGALRDRKRAILIGEKSFGKGSVQRVFPLQEFQSAIAITVARYYLPSHQCIDKVGIRPHFEIKHPLLVKLKIRAQSIYKKNPEKINDLHLKKALEVLRSKLHTRKLPESSDSSKFLVKPKGK